MLIKYFLPWIKTTNTNIAVPSTLGMDAMAQTCYSSAYNSRQRASRLRVVSLRLSVRLSINTNYTWRDISLLSEGISM